MDATQIINTERAVLSSILFDNSEFETIKDILNTEDFYAPDHAKLYQIMGELHKNEMPIDEDFIRKRLQNDTLLINVLSMTPISNAIAYAKEILEESQKREIQQLNNIVNKGIQGHESSKKILRELHEKIATIESKNTDVNVGNWEDHIQKKGGYVTLKVIEETENAKFLVDEVLPHNQISLFVGAPNVGKSALTFGFIDMLFNRKQIEHVIYIDGDNPLVYTKDRIQKLILTYGEEKIMYYSGSTTSKSDMIMRLEELCLYKDKGDKVLVVIDSLKHFIGGSVVEDLKVNELFDLLQKVRDNFKATIIGLHHTKRGKNENGDLEYVGSQAIEASTDNMFMIDKDEQDENVKLMKNVKARALIQPKTSYRVDFETMSMVDIESYEDVNLVLERLPKEGIKLNELKQLVKDTDVLKKEGLIRMSKVNDEWWCFRTYVGGVVETVFESDVADVPNILE